ncbi:MAG: DinB family protein [Bacteroidota bacterium]
MGQAQQLANRFREVILNGKWIANTNFKEKIEDLTVAQATQRVGSLNTIALLTFHINYYIAGLNQVFEEGKLEIRDKYSFELPTLETEEAWEELKQQLFRNAEVFAQHVEGLLDEDLDAPFVKEQYGDYRRNLEGMIEHSYYHLGQVSLIRKLIELG